MTDFILCADDYAMTEGVSRGILDLLAAGRISAAGAMTNRPHWPRWAHELAAFQGMADLGVHLNLTCMEPLGAMPLLAPNGLLPQLGEVARKALSTPAQAEIRAEIARQLDAFAQHMGHAPDFVDGHQHVHALPGVRGVLIAEMQARYPAGNVWLRDPSDSVAAITARRLAVPKALTVKALAQGLRAQAKAVGIPTNQGFSGFSRFDASADYGAELDAALKRPGKRHLVMCHPGHVDDELARIDSVVATRPIELAVLMRSPSLATHRPVRFRDLAG
ncbi:MAG: ChbG/HpnK family deacetylase [Bosea sp. (in: a-proteobacteria)]